MSLFLALYGLLFVLLICGFFYFSMKTEEKGSPAPAAPSSAERTEAKPAVQTKEVAPTEGGGVDPRQITDVWKGAVRSDAESFAHTKALDEGARDSRVGSKLRAAKNRGSTVQATVEQVLSSPPEPKPAAQWEAYLQLKASDMQRTKETPFLRLGDGSYTSEYQKLLNTKTKKVRSPVHFRPESVAVA